ncbi:hypothetical protein BKA56DRAFT_685672 [Ilyonectria sp. MPI-CAGE-AT-0026]|nr:hypothetical protein BKA56DRAFT_685672 [Ilyonectria sp. MPI-CAGE-AT-0026]
MVSPFESLPSLVTYEICKYLDVDARDLSALSLTSTRCATAAETFRLKCIHLRLSRKSKLLKDLKRLHETLGSSSQGYSLVRQLKLTGELLGGQSEDGDEAVECPRPTDTTKTSSYDFCMLPTTLSGEALRRFNPLQGAGNRLQPQSAEEMKQTMEEAWQPLSDLILKLSLTDLVYACSHQIPPCILRTLHAHSLETRLHMHTFSLRSYQHRDRPRDIDPDEYLLVTSPCLYSVFAKVHMWDECGRYGYDLQALKSMLGGLAPRLKLLSIWEFCPMAATPRTYSGLPDSFPPPPWRGFHGEGFNALPSSKAHLQTLVCDFSDFQTWFTHIHAEGLTTLAVHRGISLHGQGGSILSFISGISIQQVQALIETAQNMGLTSLRSLRLRLDRTPDERRAGRSMDLAVSTLIRLLPPLQSLDLEGTTLAQHTLHAVADHHGQSLTKLRLAPYDDWNDERSHFRHNDIEKLAATCLNLEQLDIVIRRTQGDADEVAIYHALAKFPRLKSVVLDLCTFYDIREPEVDEDVKKLPPSVFRKLLINVAIDSNLAQNIFHIVCSESSSVESLQLMNSGGGNLRAWCDDAAQDVLIAVGRAWDCRRERMGGEVTIESLYQVSSMFLMFLRNDFRVDYNEREPDNIGNRLDLRAVWLDLWPGPAGDRTSQWSSFPLVGA